MHELTFFRIPPAAILSLYLKHLFVIDGMEQGPAEDLATALYHAFIFLSYFTSLFGAYLADSFLGETFDQTEMTSQR